MPPKSRSDRRLLLTVRAAFVAAADPERAPAMQAYMKSSMPYHGVPMPSVRSICREAFRGIAFESRQTWERAVRGIWDEAKWREEWYAAIALSGVRAVRAYQTTESLPLYEHMIVTGAWWDVVDELATHRVGPLLGAYPGPMRREMLAWSKSDDMWKRRTAIICQARSGKDTDVKLLYACIEPSVSSKEFFLRKAIGWALRELARFEPKEVARYVREHEARLSGLSKREALKHVH